jgi:hypothetical protein
VLFRLEFYRITYSPPSRCSQVEVASGVEDVVVASTTHPHLIFSALCVDVSLESEFLQNEWGMVLIQELHKVKNPSPGLETRTGLNEEKKI